ncbi:MAG: ATP-binding cassette domain-containing protein [bacterium]|nr:ATP-binding cassette domain-containing protein [bacterium]
MNPVAPPALEVRNVSHQFGSRHALNNASFTIAASEFCVLLGLNGAGKTTLFSLITRLYDNTSGEIKALGFDVRREPGQALRRLGVVFQQRTLDLDLSVRQNLAYHAALHGLPHRYAVARAHQELERVGLSERAKQKTRELSGGEMRRVEIARALLHEPRLVLLDEPTVGLDISARQDILDRVRTLCREGRVGVLWATHLFDEILPDNQVVILHRGRVLDHGTASEIVDRTGTDDIAAAFKKLTNAADAASAATA